MCRRFNSAPSHHIIRALQRINDASQECKLGAQLLQPFAGGRRLARPNRCLSLPRLVGKCRVRGPDGIFQVQFTELLQLGVISLERVNVAFWMPHKFENGCDQTRGNSVRHLGAGRVVPSGGFGFISQNRTTLEIPLGLRVQLRWRNPVASLSGHADGRALKCIKLGG